MCACTVEVSLLPPTLRVLSVIGSSESLLCNNELFDSRTATWLPGIRNLSWHLLHVCKCFDLLLASFHADKKNRQLRQGHSIYSMRLSNFTELSKNGRGLHRQRCYSNYSLKFWDSDWACFTKASKQRNNYFPSTIIIKTVDKSRRLIILDAHE